jgi:DNA primase small subunit
VNKKNKSEGLLSPYSSNTAATVHPMLERAYDVLEPYFSECVLPEDGHGLLASKEQWDKLLDSLPPLARDTVGANLKQKWAKLMGSDKELSSQEKWNQLLQHLRVKFDLQDDREDHPNENANKRPKLSTSIQETDKKKQRVAMWPMEVVFEHTYPRLDINVSKMQNHLLKSPFCVHPKTGRVCVPINAKAVDDFDPFAVPTLAQLAQELDEYHRQHNDGIGKNVEHEWEKTILKPYFEGFQTDFLGPLQKEWRLRERDQADKEAAMRGDF